MSEELANLRRLAEWAGIAIDDRKAASLQAFRSWLEHEAIPAGGLGPNEAARLWNRHVLDSLSLSAGFKDRAVSVGTDLGSGVGLPGIPLAIVWPEVQWVLVDRAGRRTDLASRAVRVLDLSNVEILQRDLKTAPLGDLVVARAVKDPNRLLADLTGRFEGVAVLAGSRVASPGRPDAGRRRLEVPPGILDGGAHILIIEFRDNR